MRPVVFIIRDGWGVNPRADGNSVYGAKTPVIDQIRARYPHCLLDCCGEAVGLPDGYQGSSEVGHLNMGAGRIVVQELKRIDDGLSSGELFKSPKWQNLVDCFYVANDAAGVRLTPLAKLSAVAPTALQMLGIPVPSEMTTPSLLAGKEPWSKTALNV